MSQRIEHSDQIGVAVAQFAPGIDKAANLDQINELASTAASRGASIVVFPEYASYFTAELGPHSVAAAESLEGPFVVGLQTIARTLDIHLVAGMVELTDDPNRFANTVIAIDGAGTMVAKYRKLHLYDAFGQRESDWVVPGLIEPPETFTVGGFTAGLQTCYDVRFPEVTRRLVNAGVDLVLLPSEWVRGHLKEAHWRTLVTARAIENTVFIVAADQAPPVAVGNSMVVDPMGVELVTVGDETAVAVAWISRSRLDLIRSANPALQLRRFGFDLT